MEFTGFHQHREGPVGRPSDVVASPARSPTSCSPTSRRSWRRPTPRSSPRCSWPTAPRNCSTRSPPARSPARRTATRTPTCGTSAPTSRAPRPPSPRCARCSRSATPALVKTLDDEVRRRRGRAGQAPRRRRLEAAQRADPGRPQGARRRDQRARRADQQGRRGRGASESTRSPDAKWTVSGIGRRRRRSALAGAGAPARPSRWPRPVASARLAVDGPAAGRAPRTARRGAVLRRAPGRHRHAGAGPAALRRVRRHHRRSAPSWSTCCENWTGRRRADDRRAGRRCASARSAAPPEAPPDDTGEALGLPPSGLTLTIGFGADAVPRRRRAGTGSASPTAARPRWPTCRTSPATRSSRRSPAATCACRRAPTTRRWPCTRSATWPASAWAWSACAGRSWASAARRRRPRRRPRRATSSGSRTAPRNLKAEDAALLDEQLWVQPGDGPDWMAGGAYLVTRKIRMLIETWDRTLARRAGGDRRADQGRRRAAGPAGRVRRARLRRSRATTASR